MLRVAVGDVMTRNFISVKPDSSLLDCSKKLIKNKGINSLMVLHDKRLVGILTSRDILWAITKKRDIEKIKKIKAIDVATKKVAVIKPSADIYQAIQKMKTFGFRRLPVISRGEILGVITIKDILHINPDLYKELAEISKIRAEEKEYIHSTKGEGLCDNCSAFSDLLKVNGKMLCPDCREELY